ncbi:sensor histidine kinase [Streptomyces sp. NPDC102360]|uniref:sensor histidine kinase n=1 Tax=Streptomyces sp. NPDC102360 TaxID=3366160 RepID=UPI0037FE8313
MTSRTRWAPRTLRGRLSLVALTTATLVMALLTIVFNAVVREHLQHQADDELRTRAAAVTATLDTRHRPVRVLETPDDQFLDTNVWVFDGSRLIEQPPSTNPALARLAVSLADTGRPHCATTGQPDGVRLCARPVAHTGGAATVVAALDLSPYQSSADALLFGSLALDVVMLACTYALTRLAVRRALRPVHTMTEQAAQWSATASDERFTGVTRPHELACLGGSLDALLDRIRALLRHEQQLTGELSHELRTPLSRVVAELDWLSSRPRSPLQVEAGHARIAASAQSMRTICDTLLDAARDAAATPPTGTCDAPTVLRRLAQHADTLGQVTVTLETAGPAPRAGVPEALLERIASPLLTNAVRYARTGIVVHIRREQGHIRLTLTDDGPGVPASFTGQLFQPGRRADPHDGHGGAGLGLPLARRLARSAGGDVTHDADYASGARFVITLPPG